MPYSLSRSELFSIKEVETAFSTQRLLPSPDDIPEEFYRGNLYTKLAEALFHDDSLPQLNIIFRDGFNDASTPAALNRCVRAHLLSHGPSHEHKIAGVGLMIAQVCELRPIPM